MHQTKFTDAMVKAMSFVMSKLGAKGVFHNTLLFSGRFLVGRPRDALQAKLTRRHLRSSEFHTSVNSSSPSFPHLEVL